MWNGNVNISVDDFMFSLRRVGDVRDASWSSVPLSLYLDPVSIVKCGRYSHVYAYM
jgi:hypothetical protein